MEIINRKDCTPFITKDTSEIREIMAYRNSSCKKTSLAEATLYPGKSTDGHIHPVTEEIYYILKGTGKIRIENEEEQVASGDCILIKPGDYHKIWNTGDDKLVFLCVCAPAYEHEDTVIKD